MRPSSNGVFFLSIERYRVHMYSEPVSLWYCVWLTKDSCDAGALLNIAESSICHVVYWSPFLMRKEPSTAKTMFLVLSSWENRRQGSHGFAGQCKTALSGHWPSDQTNRQAVGPHVGCCCSQLPPLFIIITQPESVYLLPSREGWVDLANVVRVCNPCRKLYRTVAFGKKQRRSMVLQYRFSYDIRHKRNYFHSIGSHLHRENLLLN